MHTLRYTTPQHRLTSGTEAFEEACRFARSLATRAEPYGAWTYAARHPYPLFRVASLVLRLPRVVIALSDSEQGRILATELLAATRGIPTGRFAQAVLSTHQSEVEYLRGRRKQAVRTNLRRCYDLGVECREVPDIDERTALRHEISGYGDTNWWCELGWDSSPKRVFTARRRGRELLAVASLVVDGTWAWLDLLHKVSTCPSGGLARYALHFEMHRRLREGGVRWLWAGNGITLEPGLQYFQYLLGYEIYNLKPGAGSTVP